MNNQFTNKLKAIKKFLSLIILFVILISCQNNRENTTLALETLNTYMIDRDDTKDSIILKSAHVIPTENQFNALKNEFIAFIHFGPNTFTRMEWGTGKEDPKIFDLKNLDTDQWCKAIKDAGMKMVIFTAKHHDGFCLWQSRYTQHGIMDTNFEAGHGDVLRELSKSVEKYGLKLGIYLSPADLYQIENEKGLYGNLSKPSLRTIPRPVEGRPFKNPLTFEFEVDDYNEYFLNQLYELLTEYGPIHEVWFDGAHPKRKGGQTYNYDAWKKVIRTLAPEAVIFGKEDVRWCGNEGGATRDSEWNVIPFSKDPNSNGHFVDLTEEIIGSRDQLYDSKYLHYQQAETNTSIREGWFYRDENNQQVRSADDVFDIYERSVGGNSTFLLNIPPNRDGKLSSKDVEVLREVGKRINETYAIDQLEKSNLPKEVLDHNDDSFFALNKDQLSLDIQTPNPITINRFVIQESVQSHGERIEEFQLEAWIDHQWKLISKATNIGYKRILRFETITTTKLRLSVLKTRFIPVINKISAHYYTPKPPELLLERSYDGMVSISPKQHQFNWKIHKNKSENKENKDIDFKFTLDGSEPTISSKSYDKPFYFQSGTIKARAFIGNQFGPITQNEFGVPKNEISLMSVDSWRNENTASLAFDSNTDTFWQSKDTDIHYIELDLGSLVDLTGFSYTPPHNHKLGLIESGVLKTSIDGKKWTKGIDFNFGNIINDPTSRKKMFKQAIQSRYIRMEVHTIAGGIKSASIAELDFFVKNN